MRWYVLVRSLNFNMVISGKLSVMHSIHNRANIVISVKIKLLIPYG